MQNISKLRANAQILFALLRRDLVVFKSQARELIINSLSWPFCTALVFGYIMPQLGTGEDYGGFVVVGTIVFALFYRCAMDAYTLTTDIDTVGRIESELVMPVSRLTIFARYAISMGLRAFIQFLPMPFFSKLLLWNRFPLDQFSLFKFILNNLAMCLAFGTFGILVAACVKSATYFNFQVRVIDQMGFLGCFMFKWKVLYAILPVAGMLNFLNPVTHAMEAQRVAFFGQAGLINFWVSMAMLTMTTIVFMSAAMYGFKKRLDYV